MSGIVGYLEEANNSKKSLGQNGSNTEGWLIRSRPPTHPGSPGSGNAVKRQ